jgi:RNA polymerase-interacting CarD/CdnL/TRCF family regulator
MTSTANGGPMSGGRRRIDRVLADNFTTDLESIELDDLRGRRREAEQEEADLSYVRRMLQGRMDILRAELARRSGSSEAKIVDHLSQVLSDTARHDHGLGRFLRVEPSRVDEHRREVEQLIADVGISEVDGNSDDEIRGALGRLEEFENAVSEDRRSVQKAMDALTAEVAGRYKSGSASVDDLLAERPSS